MSLMTVYHGGCQAFERPEIRVGKYTKDFGNGFYCTVIKDSKIVSVYDVRLISGLRILEFKEMSDDWLDFIADCRSGKTHDYDIVIGAMADDQIYSYVADYIEGSITREQFWILARFKYPTHQIVFCTDDALKCLTYRCFEVIK